MKPPLRILHLEDNPADAELIQAILETEGIICDVTRVDTQADFFASIEHGGFDLILTDYTLPSFDGLSALKIALEKCPKVLCVRFCCWIRMAIAFGTAQRRAFQRAISTRSTVALSVLLRDRAERPLTAKNQ